MVKSDVRQDYYAILDLETSADPNEIKRQYRKLGEHLECSDLNICGHHLPTRKH